MIRDEFITNNNVKFIESIESLPMTSPEFLSKNVVEDIRKFHTSVPGYKKTPLVSLPALSKQLGIKGIYVKDESFRFGLNAFKGLGGIYAVTSIICKKLGFNIKNITLNDLLQPEIKNKIKDFVFITATDGNHGKGIAWASKIFSCDAYVYMPKGTVKSRKEAIEELGAKEVIITQENYDETVRIAYKRAKKNGWCFIQDTAWEGYTDIPTKIVQGYSTLALECYEQLNEIGIEAPTHLFLQAGVGAFAGGFLGCFSNLYHDKLPITTIMEPENVACIYESARQNDKNPHNALGNCETIMAGLNCAEPCLITYPILRDYATFYASCPDNITKRGMKLLGKPLHNDPKIISGESGAVGTGLLHHIMTEPSCATIRTKMKLNKNSTVLLISTEGATDPENYNKIVNLTKS